MYKSLCFLFLLFIVFHLSFVIYSKLLMTLLFINIILLIAMIIVYFNISCRVSYLLWMSYLCLYSAYLKWRWISHIAHVGVVLRCVISANVLYMPRRVVDRRVQPYRVLCSPPSAYI